MKPLDGLLVLDLSQYLAGPFAAMRLADLGARVIKVERPGTGDNSRRLTLSNLVVDGDSTVFHCMNRNKESYAADLKDPGDLARVKELIARADVLIENFRPGTMERLGLGYEDLRRMNPGLVYASVTGYGREGPWRDKPGQDLLVQAMSGMMWLNGHSDTGPVAFGLSIVDMHASMRLVQGIVATLLRRGRGGAGGLVEMSLLEAALDLQFEVLTTYFNDGGKLPKKSRMNNAHAYLAAPYGIYETKDGYIALAMGSVKELGLLLQSPELLTYSDPGTWFSKRDEIKKIIADCVRSQNTRILLNTLEQGNYWCAEVLTVERFTEHEGFKALNMIQEIRRPSGAALLTTRCPIRIDEQLLTASKWAPVLGEDTRRIDLELASPHLGATGVNNAALIRGAKGKPLDGMLVLDLSQFLSGPSAALSLADLGARVIKIEHPERGDLSRSLYVSDLMIDGDSSIFHAINRNKEGFSANLKVSD
ncbi:MAG: CaiB/BaiF CoA transferase family protein, partial [Sulfobacillus sp.]